MKKMIVVVSLLVLSPLASALSPVVGPYLLKSIGQPGNGKWGQCRIYPHAAFIQTSKSTLALKFQPVAPEWMEAKIREATKEQMKVVALHNRATVPAIEVSTGIIWTRQPVSDFTLFLDSGDVQQREGTAAADLLHLVQFYCSQLRAE